VTRFGENLGIAYQMVDDLLDFVGVERALGKPVGSDVREGRATLPLIRALREASEADRTDFLALLRSDGATGDRWTDVVEFVERHGGTDYCRKTVGHYVEAAKEALRDVAPGDARDGLVGIAEYVAGKCP